MNIVIVDDEPLARARLRELLSELGGHSLSEAANGREALLKVNELRPDVLLLDIRMPDMDGLEAAAHLAKLDTPPALIFTTAFGDHALAAFEANAVDYLLKPIAKERLAAALVKAQRLSQTQTTALQRGMETRARTYISAFVRGSIQLVQATEVIYFKADQKYVTVRHAAGQVLIEDSLKTLETEFGERFLRIHRNALVACAAIVALEKDKLGNVAIRLRGVDETLEVSRRHLAAVRKYLKAKPR